MSFTNYKIYLDKDIHDTLISILTDTRNQYAKYSIVLSKLYNVNISEYINLPSVLTNIIDEYSIENVHIYMLVTNILPKIRIKLQYDDCTVTLYTSGKQVNTSGLMMNNYKMLYNDVEIMLECKSNSIITLQKYPAYINKIINMYVHQYDIHDYVYESSFDKSHQINSTTYNEDPLGTNRLNKIVIIDITKFEELIMILKVFHDILHNL